MSRPSNDYHNYVFRDGKLVGEFESMYRHSTNVPWHQDEQAQWIDIRLTATMLQGLGSFAQIHDLSCGLGYYLELLRATLDAPPNGAFGYDIAPTACEKARALFPRSTFNTLDLTQPAAATALIPADSAGPKLFVIRGTLWYVFPKIADVVATTRAVMTAADRLLVVQNFPPLDGPFIGKDVIPDPAALIRHFSARFAPVRHIWYQDTLKTANDNWFIGLFSPRQ